MQPFDCLAQNIRLLGPHLLEASAGTGKTFAIEHIYVRLVLEGFDLEQILVVTFTKAATRELKTRIRNNLEKAYTQLLKNDMQWPYLQKTLPNAVEYIARALARFDRNQIFTIHSFCFRMLQEFGFSANIPCSTDITGSIPKRLKQAAQDFLEFGIDEKIISQEQMGEILKTYTSLPELVTALLQCKAALHPLQAAWKPIEEAILAEEEHWDPDTIMIQMGRAMGSPPFVSQVEKKYAAAIIDEFQDTDETQWDIFHRLFMNKSLYLVGDPKQAIYRFRKADVYTYLKARQALGEENVFHLDTNYRSSKKLVDALNTLFMGHALSLPKANASLSIHPVKAGISSDVPFSDDKGAIHFLLAEGDPNALFKEVFLPFAVQELDKFRFLSCAILVKDRYQAEAAIQLLQKQGISAAAKSHVPLGQTMACNAIQELFEALENPHDQNAAKIVSLGPFASINIAECKALLDEKGFIALSQKVLQQPYLSPGTREVFEYLFSWVSTEGFTFYGVHRCLDCLKQDEEKLLRPSSTDSFVQVMTLHVSKGLEFDVVFALGLATRPPVPDSEVEEFEAEKERLLYVAMTRAKYRLYVPYVSGEQKKETQSPMELFCKNRNMQDFLTDLSRNASITYEKLQQPISLVPRSVITKETVLASALQPHPYHPCYLQSFTMLSQKKGGEFSPSVQEGYSLQSMPRGTNTGNVIHSIFETLFSAKKPIWKEEKAIASVVADAIRFSSLALWQEAIQQMVQSVLALPLIGDFALHDVDPEQVQVEMEFLYPAGAHFVKGFIDLVFCYEGRYYFVDWKTNWLSEYTEDAMHTALDENDYYLQSSIYTEALQRYLSKDRFGGSFYIFVRGIAACKVH